MKFEDLTIFDLDLIKSLAVQLIVNTKISNRYEALANVVIGCAEAKGYDLIGIPPKIVEKIVKDMTPPFRLGFSEKEETPDEVIKNIIDYLKNSGVTFHLSNRESTWSKPKPAWYTKYDDRKKPWVM